MKKDIFRHNLLELLSEKYVDSMKNNDEVGYTYKYLENKFNINEKELFKLIAELFSSKEIQLYNPTGDKEKLGICATNEGISSYSSEKYIYRHNYLKRTIIKDYIQIIIPVLSLIVAFTAICIKIETADAENEKSIQTLTKEIETLKNSMKIDAHRNDKVIKR